jgi:hypothetical protein
MARWLGITELEEALAQVRARLHRDGDPGAAAATDAEQGTLNM